MYRFNEWVSFVFDRPVAPRWEEEWCWEDSAEAEFERWAVNPTLNVIRLTHLFRTPAALAPFTRDQIGQGLSFLMCPSPYNFGEELYEPTVERGVRLSCIAATPLFFADYLAGQCPRTKVTYRAHDTDELERVCFMWWDPWPDRGRNEPGADSAAVDSAVLDALAAIGRLRSVACAESALHGLGHRYETSPERVDGIVADMLSHSSEWPRELVEYAAAARRGAVE